MKDVNYGPLSGLIGTWRGDKGMDIAPEPDGTEENPFYETIVFEAAGDVDNAETQELAIVRYHQEVRRKSNDEVFHDQVGYWTWEAESDGVVQSLTIPRAVALVAGGSYKREGDQLVFAVAARLGDPDWGISQSPFMRDNASTISYEHRLTLAGDELSYSQVSMVAIYGRTFEHTDTSELQRA